MLAGQLNVFTQSEHGLLGIALDPGFASNGWLYLYYSPSGASLNRLSRFTVEVNQLVSGSEKILLTIPTNRVNTNHQAGSLAFGPGGELYLSTGDNTNPFESSGFNPIDERAGRAIFDAQRSAANTADLRGKILRILPQADGTYSIPEGNLFPADGSAGRPEIYVMGDRNPFRISVDSETGWLYWGEVGPDASNDSASRGPRGYDELNQARGAANFGWPYFIADNKAYRDYNFATMTSGPAFNPAAPANDSPNNTGPQSLPPAQPALIWYPYNASTQFPELGSGGRTIAAGPVYHFDPLLQSEIKLPEYYDNTLFIYEWSRRWIKEVKLDASGNILKINPFAPDIPLSRPIELEIGPDGALYVLEWGSEFGGGSSDAQLVRIEFLGNSRIVSADFNDDKTIDGSDMVAWQRGLGIAGGALRGDGDANVNGVVDAQDLAVWRSQFGQATAAAEISVSADPPAPAAAQATLDSVFSAGDFTGLFADRTAFRPWGRPRLRLAGGR
jgi:cytochrome c